MACLGMQAQNLQVSGTVVSKSDGLPVIGATVLEKGTTNGTITDFDGKFSLTVKQGAEIVVSYVGFKSQTLKANSVLNIVLEEDSEMLEEVVVTGYTTQRKADLTGAVSVVSVDELSKQNENNPMKALQGRVPGMNITADGNPSGSTTIRIRGVGTLNNNDPLYIIDGVPTKAGMHELNGNDIESIQVLKDAASASIYGSRAANGVIIITTKKGKDGQLKINFDASVSASMYNNKLNSTCKCNRILINNLFKFFVWREVSKSFTRSIIEFIFNPLNLFVGYFTKVLTLWDILPDKPVGVFIGTTFP